MPLRKGISLLCLVLALWGNGHAQGVRGMVNLGTGLAFVQGSVPGRQLPVAAWYGGVSVMVNLSESLMLESGLGYERRGYGADSTLHDYSRDMHVIAGSKATRHYLLLPLQLLGRVYSSKRVSCWLGGGMNYGVMFSARNRYSFTTYINGRELEHMTQEYNPKIGLLQVGRSMVRGKEYIHLFAFDTGIKVQAAIMLQDRYLLRVYYNRSLYDTDAAIGLPDYMKYRQRTVGLSMGIIL